jgi:hypothetical protein
MVKVICEMQECVYYIHKPEDGEAYQHQCGNDEIEIGYFLEDFARCYTFENKEIRQAGGEMETLKQKEKPEGKDASKVDETLPKMAAKVFHPVLKGDRDDEIE